MKTRPQDNGLPATLLTTNVIGGEEVSSPDTYASRNPANRDDVVTLSPESTAEQVADACAKSRAAQLKWARTPAPQRAQVIGRTGATGLALGDHLHFTVLLHGLPVRPLEWWDESWIDNRIAAKLGGVLGFVKGEG